MRSTEILFFHLSLNRIRERWRQCASNFFKINKYIDINIMKFTFATAEEGFDNHIDNSVSILNVRHF